MEMDFIIFLSNKNKQALNFIVALKYLVFSNDFLLPHYRHQIEVFSICLQHRKQQRLTPSNAPPPQHPDSLRATLPHLQYISILFLQLHFRLIF